VTFLYCYKHNSIAKQLQSCIAEKYEESGIQAMWEDYNYLMYHVIPTKETNTGR